MSGEEHLAQITDVNYLEDLSLFGVNLAVKGYDSDGDNSYYLSLDSSEGDDLKGIGNGEKRDVIEKIKDLERDIEKESKVNITVKEEGMGLDRTDAIEEVIEVLNEY